MESEDLDLLAAALRADSSDTRTLVEALATKFEAALPDKATVKRKSARPFSSKQRIEEIAIKLGDDTYTLSLAGDELSARRKKVVGGVAIRNEEVSLDDWLNQLTETLRAEADRSEAARIALERLLAP